MPEMVSHPGAAEIILLEIAGCFLHALEFPKAYRIETACLYSLISCTWAVVAGMACSAISGLIMKVLHVSQCLTGK